MINGFADTRRRESHSAIRTESPQQMIVRMPCVRCAHRKLHRLTSIVLEAIASFLCGRHFLHVFSSRGDAAATRAHSVEQSFIRQTKQRRAQFVAEVSITEESDRCAEGRVAEMPFASPYCPYRAQIRRAHVQSRARFAVSPSMRVRSHASRLARAHHFTIPKIRGGRLYS